MIIKMTLKSKEHMPILYRFASNMRTMLSNCGSARANQNSDEDLLERHQAIVINDYEKKLLIRQIRYDWLDFVDSFHEDQKQFLVSKFKVSIQYSLKNKDQGGIYIYIFYPQGSVVIQ